MDHVAGMTGPRHLSQLQLISATLFDPEAVARQIDAGGRATGVMVLLATVSAALTWLGIGLTVDVLRHDPSIAAGQAATAADWATRFRGFIAVATPVVLLLKWTVVTTMVWTACIAAGRITRYARIFAVVVCCSAAQVLHLALGVAIMTVRAPGAGSLAELRPLTGLNLFWPHLQGPLAELLAAVNPFEAWFVVALTAALRVVAGLGPVTAALCVLPAWIFVTAVQVALTTLNS